MNFNAQSKGLVILENKMQELERGRVLIEGKGREVGGTHVSRNLIDIPIYNMVRVYKFETKDLIFSKLF